VQNRVDIAGRWIGLRWSEPGFDGGMMTYLRSPLHSGAAQANISVVVGVYEEGVRAKHQLYVQGKLALISGNADRVYRAIVRAISDLAAEQPKGSLAVQAAVVITADGQTILVDRRLGQNLWNLDRRLRRQGCRVFDTATVTVDVGARALILTCPTDLIGHGAEMMLSAHANDANGFDDLRGGSLPISRLVYRGAGEGASLSETLAEAAPMAQQPDGVLRVADLERLLDLLRHTESRSVVFDDADAFMDAIGLSSS
jgi:hypothetical protein